MANVGTFLLSSPTSVTALVVKEEHKILIQLIFQYRLAAAVIKHFELVQFELITTAADWNIF